MPTFIFEKDQIASRGGIAQAEVPAIKCQECNQSAVIVAVYKHVEADKKKNPDRYVLAPGEYPVRGRAVIQLDCHVSKAEAVMTREPVKLESEELFKIAFRACGVLAKQWPALLKTCEAESEKAIEKAKETAESKPREGATKVVGSVEFVEFTPN